jgi:hypothetical protein
MVRALALRSSLLAAGLLLGFERSAVGQTQPAPNGFALLGLESVRVGPGVRVQPGAVGATGGSIRLAARTMVPGSVVADSVRVARHARVGRLFCRVASGGAFGPGVVGGPTVGGAPIPGCRALTVPVVDPVLLMPVAVVPGSSDLAVPPRTGSAPVAAGAFGIVTVGRGSLLQLAGGAYQMRSIRLARAARLVCLDACRIGVAESVRVGSRAQLGAAQGLRPDRARIDVAGGDVAFRTGPRAVVAATIFAPAGSVVLGADGEYRGAYVGRSVTVRARSRVIEMSALVPPS